MRKVHAIYLHWSDADILWRDILVEVIGDKHNLTEYDPSKPVEPQFAGVEVLLDHGGRMATREIINASADLKLWQMISVGYDSVDLGIIDGRDIRVCHCPGETSAPGLAEGAMMFMLMFAKQYQRAQADVKEGKICNFVIDELDGKVLAIVGFGASGRKLAFLARAFGMKLMIIEPRDIEPAVLDELNPVSVGKPDKLDEAMAQADFVSLHLTLSPETRGIIDERRIGLMKRTVCFINVARAGLVDEDALNRALMEGRIAGIGSDVFADNKPGREIAIFGDENLMALPHIAGTTFATIRRRSQVCLDNLDRIAQGEEPNYRVSK
jgi:phosphoglycerate dehydrogenase-like enzyme